MKTVKIKDIRDLTKDMGKYIKFVGIIIVLLLIITAILFIILNFEYTINSVQYIINSVQYIINDILSNLEGYVLTGLIVYVVIMAFLGEDIKFLFIFYLVSSLATPLFCYIAEHIVGYLESILC